MLFIANTNRVQTAFSDWKDEQNIDNDIKSQIRVGCQTIPNPKDWTDPFDSSHYQKKQLQ